MNPKMSKEKVETKEKFSQVPVEESKESKQRDNVSSVIMMLKHEIEAALKLSSTSHTKESADALWSVLVSIKEKIHQLDQFSKL